MFWQYVAAALTGVGSFLGVMLALDQLTAASRLRRWATFTLAMQGNDVKRDPVLESARQVALARLLARDAVPLWRFVLPGLFLMAALYTPGLALVEWHALPPSELVGAFGFSLTGSVFGSVVLLSLIRERKRIVRCYLDGVFPIRSRSSFNAMLDMGAASGFWRAAGLAVASYGLSLGIGMLWTGNFYGSLLAAFSGSCALFIVASLWAWIGKDGTELPMPSAGLDHYPVTWERPLRTTGEPVTRRSQIAADATEQGPGNDPHRRRSEAEERM